MKKIIEIKLNGKKIQEHVVEGLICPLTVRSKEGGISLWAMVDDEDATQWILEILLAVTDRDLPEGIDGYEYLGTVELDDGNIMFHIFDRGLNLTNLAKKEVGNEG